jgi:hypothetical protein
MCSPIFLAAYDIARLCQVEFTPARKHPDWAAKLNALGMVIFDTPAFRRLRPYTQKRYRAWLQEFVYQIGGRCVPTLRYRGMEQAYKAHPTATSLRKLCAEFRKLLNRAANLKAHTDGYQPPPREEAPREAVSPFASMSPEQRRAVEQGVARLRATRPQRVPSADTGTELQQRFRAFVAERKRLRCRPKQTRLAFEKRRQASR